MPSTLEVDFRHSGWAPTRARVRRVLASTGAGETRIERFDRCGSDAWVATDSGGEGRLAVVSSTCHDRWCLPCARSRARVIGGNLATAIGECSCRMITLTLRSRPVALRSEVDRLIKCFARLRRSDVWKRHVSGGAAFTEITRGARGDHWHVHLHAICFGSFIPHDMLRSTWHSITGDSKIVDVRAIGRSTDDSERAIGYVLKYATKGLNVCKLKSDDHLAEAMLALKGRKLVIAFGDWSDARLTERKAKTRWVRLEPLHQVIEAADSGDAEAIDLLRRLGRRPLADDDDATASLGPIPPPEGT